MQNDIVKPPKEPAEKPASASPSQPPAVENSPAVSDPVVAQDPASKPVADELPAGDAQISNAKQAEPAPVAKPHKSSGLAPVVIITAIVCLALIGLAVYSSVR